MQVFKNKELWRKSIGSSLRKCIDLIKKNLIYEDRNNLILKID